MIIKEITKSEFEKRFPATSTYGSDNMAVYLENGVILRENEWNGEDYLVDEKIYKPVYAFFVLAEQWRIIGYEERM